LSLRTPDGLESKVVLPAIDLAARRASRAAKQPAAKDGPKDWSLTYRNDIAVLKMDDWVTYNTKWDWRGFLDNAFLELAAKRPKGLIVDLRGNEGGEDCGHEIVARLIDKDLALEAYERRVRFRKAPENLWPYLNTWDNSFRSLGEGAEDGGDGFYRLKATVEGGQVIQPKGPRFLGKVAVLTDAGNSSATFQFASLMKREKLGSLIGETTGGNQRGINGGAFFFLQLPASKLEAELPLIGTFPKGERPDAGLEPDIAVAETVEDIAAGRDPVMETALTRLRG
jgi:C-terminal processing protease CtpA/Prc